MKKQILAFVCTTVFLSSHINNVSAAPSVTAKENLAKLLATRICTGCDLSGLNFNRMDLSKVNLEGADLSMSTFFLTNLSYANLRNTTMSGAVFGGADLGDADLTGADLRGVSLDSAYLGGTKMTGEIVTTKPFEDIGVDEVEKDVYVESQSIPKKSPKQKEVNVSKRRDFSETPPVLSVTDEKSAVEVEEIAVPQVETVAESSPPVTNVPKAPPVKKNKMVQKVSVPVVVAEEVNTGSVDGAVVVADATKQVDMASADITAVEGKSVSTFVEPTVETSEIDEEKRMKLEQLLDTKKCYGCDLSDTDLSHENLKNADLEQANLSGSNLEKANLKGANLKGALLVGVNLKKANLENADLYKATLTGADLTGAKQKNASFDDALIEGTIGLERNLMLPGQ